MKSLFESNSYKILGLDTASSQKDAARRSKEIEKLLQIDEVPAYDTDIALLDNNRIGSEVKAAYQKLSSPTKRVSEYFFWFTLNGTEDEQAMSSLANDDYNAAIVIWGRTAATDSARGLMAKKNLAILHSLMMWNDGNEESRDESIKLWHELINSNSFWPAFTKIYALHDELGTSESAIKSFIAGAAEILADFYASVRNKYDDNEYVAAFSKVFGVKGAQVQKDLIDPIYESINTASEELATIEIANDEALSSEKLNNIKKLVKGLQRDFSKLKELNFYDDSSTKAMRDKAAMAIRSVYIDLFGNLNDSSKTLPLLKIALDICGTPGTAGRLKEDLLFYRNSIASEKVVKPINDLIEGEEHREALALIASERPKNKSNKELQEYFTNRTKLCVTAIAVTDIVSAKQLFDDGKYDQAKPAFIAVKNFILEYIEYFSIDIDQVNNLLVEADLVASRAQQTGFDSVDSYRDSIIANGEEAFGENFEQTIVIILLDSALWSNLCIQMPSIKRKNTAKRGLGTVGGWIGWFVVLSIIGAIFGNSGGSGGSSGSGNSAYQTCAAEADSLKSQVASLDTQMESEKSAGNYDAYNSQVAQENSLVNQYNAKADECNKLR